MNTPITNVTLTVLVLLYIFLSVNVINYRRKNKINLGDQSDNKILRKIRMHANFAEYAPIGLLIVFLLEFNNANPALIQTTALLLVIGRFLHPYSISENNKFGLLRPISMALTFTSLLIGSGTLLFLTLNA
jgi:uncharacterized membrane protein YecN with MAPEG domain